VESKTSFVNRVIKKFNLSPAKAKKFAALMDEVYPEPPKKKATVAKRKTRA